MFGKNVIRKPVKEYNGSLEVKEIFATFQGEGFYGGHDALFIRLGGCNLACSFCDTDFEDYTKIEVDKIIKHAKLLIAESGKAIKLIVITGGEPLRQPIEDLCQKLINDGYKVQIETNGTLFRPLPSEVEIVCSPKNYGHNAYQRIREDLLNRITCLKFLIAKDNPKYNFIPEVGQTDYNIPVYIQAIDENNAKKNQENLHFAIDLCLQYRCNLSVQMHKIKDVR